MRYCLGVWLVVCAASAAWGAQDVRVTSPDGNVEIVFAVKAQGDAPGCLFYSVSYKGRAVIRESRLGLSFKDAAPLAGNFEVAAVARAGRASEWRPPYGEREVIPDRYSEAVVDVREKGRQGRQLRLTFRAYDEGAAFCYTIPRQMGLERVTVAAEDTRFALPEGSFCWVTTSAQGTYERVALADMKKIAERPLTLELPGDLFAAIAEARLVDYARMRLAPAKGEPDTLTPSLGSEVAAGLPLVTPWRVIFVAERPGDLMEHDYLLMNLNPPCAIADTLWLKPGKVIREVTLSTAGGKACVDFAAAHNLQYVEYDAGWYGPENDGKADATRVSVDPKRNPVNDLDLQAVLAYARQKNVGILLYVNRRALERQLDDILPLYQKWGVAGLKFGFVNVGPQQWTTWLHEAVRKAAGHRMVVDIHDEYRPTGFSRTYPNLMTQEGIGGNETMPTATHNVTLPFTRFVAGAADYTICYYTDRIKTTHAHQLALAAVFYSPLQFVFWYDKPSAWQGEPEMEWFERVPTVWQDTRVLAGEIGRFITVARRSGQEWYVGTLTNVDARTLDVPLAFLDPGRKYVAHLYEDAEPDGKSRTNVRISRLIVDSATVLRAALRPSGGQAVRLVPAKPEDLRALAPYRAP
ncbi:MAG: glycoside hydrolase family 97 catalytic domain-containing protein [Planctomycetota bacterium]|nr:glycoside hydrolase family 97 catalytic domain-containing protein [Planctomycetota bacterium]